MAAYVLTQAGAKVVMLEAGRMWDNSKDSAMLAWPYHGYEAEIVTSPGHFSWASSRCSHLMTGSRWFGR